MTVRAFVLALAAAVVLASGGLAAVVADGEALAREDDARLDRKITISADGVPVTTLLSALSADTGVAMTAGVDKDDWMAQDRRIIAHVSNMPLRVLMREMAGVLRFQWSRFGDEGKWTYRLWQNKQQRIEEASLRDSEEDAQSRRFREKRENVLADIANLGSLSAADADKLRESDPWRYVLATEPLGRDVAEFMGSFPEAGNAFVQGIEAGFPVVSLPPSLQEAVRRIAESYDSLTRSVGNAQDNSSLLGNFSKLQITINRGRVGAGNDIVSKSMLGRIEIGLGDDRMTIPVLDPSAPFARALGRAIVRLKSGQSRQDVGEQLQREVEAAAQAAMTDDAPSRDISSDPALAKPVKIFDVSSNSPLTETLKVLSERTGMNIVSDYFIAKPPSLPGGTMTLGRCLESIRLAYGSNWTKAGSTLRFQDKEWFRKRAREIPAVWLNYWTSRGRANEGLNLDDLVQIANLRDEQIDHTIMADPALTGYGAGEAARNRRILRFVALLDSAQYGSLQTQLQVSSLDARQWAALRAALEERGSAYAAAEKGSQWVKLARSGSDMTEHTITFYAGVGEPPVAFKITTGIIYNRAEEGPLADKINK